MYKKHCSFSFITLLIMNELVQFLDKFQIATLEPKGIAV